MSHDRAQLDALLDSTTLAHVAYVDDEGRPCVLPTGIARWREQIIMHGSTGSRWLRLVGDGRPVAVSVAELTAVVVGHSGYNTGVHGRSAVLYGQLAEVAADDKTAALDRLLDRYLTGRSHEVRPPSAKELAATRVLAMPIDRWSVRVLDGEPAPPADETDAAAWSGTVAVTARTATVEPSRTNRAEAPPSVLRLATRFDA